MGGGTIAVCVAVAYFLGALLTAYICGRWKFGEGTTCNNVMLWPLSLPILAFMWAYSKGERH